MTHQSLRAHVNHTRPLILKSGNRKRGGLVQRPVVWKRSRHVAAVHGRGVSGRVAGAGRAAAGRRMGDVRGDDGSEDLPALRQGTRNTPNRKSSLWRFLNYF